MVIGMPKSKSEKEEIEARYNHKDLPKIKNVFSYTYFCLVKIGAYLFFGTGAVFLAIFVFPFIRLFASRKDKDFGITARAYVSHTFRWFLKILAGFGGSRLVVEDRMTYRNIHGKIIVANHPSILDFVYIMSLVPNSTCIVRGSLTKTPLAGVIKQAYITNSTDFDELCAECKKVTDQGCNVIIFPEGTRTPRHGKNNYKKGAARIALYCGCDVQPLFIGGTDKYGLGKHDPFWSYNHIERYLYDIKMLPVIPTKEYKELSEPIAAKHLTQKMEEVITAAGQDYDNNHTTKTVNNY